VCHVCDLKDIYKRSMLSINIYLICFAYNFSFISSFYSYCGRLRFYLETTDYIYLILIFSIVKLNVLPWVAVDLHHIFKMPLDAVSTVPVLLLIIHYL
jgi:hypothetical protein